MYLNLSQYYCIIIYIKKETAMITVEQFLQTINYKITGGSEFLWKCYGPDAYSIDSDIYDHYSASIYFDTKTSEVFEINVCDEVNNRQYRWVNPDFTEAYAKEVTARGLDGNEFLLEYTTIEVEYDMLEKLVGIINKTEYDTRIVIEIEMADEDFRIYAMAAHKMDVTFNEFVEIAIRAAVEKYESEAEWV